MSSSRCCTARTAKTARCRDCSSWPTCPYVGAGVLASAVGMDKAAMKLVFAAKGLPICDYEVVLRRDWQRDERATLQTVVNRLGFPVFVKPANLGSSVGISKAKHATELRTAIKLAAEFDRKVIVEAAVPQAREIEVAVLGNDEPEASVPGEIIPSREFYDYEAKYLDDDSRDCHSGAAAARLSRRNPAARGGGVQGASTARAWRASTSCWPATSGSLYVNELNTIPGFTTISMYSKMWAASGVSYPQLLDRLIALAIERHAREAATADEHVTDAHKFLTFHGTFVLDTEMYRFIIYIWYDDGVFTPSLVPKRRASSFW